MTVGDNSWKISKKSGKLNKENAEQGKKKMLTDKMYRDTKILGKSRDIKAISNRTLQLVGALTGRYHKCHFGILEQ